MNQLHEVVKAHNHLIPYLFGLGKTVKGEIGLELETIGQRLPQSFIETKLWCVKQDNSIKVRPGEMGSEYILMQPVGRLKVQVALEELMKEFHKAGAKVEEGRISNSVHVHINAQDLTMKQVFTWLATYFLFEEFLVRWAGEDREGNLFCLRAKDAEGLIRGLARAAKEDDFGFFTNKNFRYSAVNCMSLSKFGSLEFRALRGTAQQDLIMTWVETLLAIKDRSLEYENPVAVLADFSKRTCLGMTRHVLPKPMRDFCFQQDDFESAMYGGARLAQDFAFSTTWSNAKAPAEKLVKIKIPAGSTQIFSSYVGNSNHTWGTADTAPTPVTPQPPPTLQATWYGLVTQSGTFKQVIEIGVPGAMNRTIKNQLALAWMAQGQSLGWKVGGLQGQVYLARFNGQGGFLDWVRATHFEPL